MKLLLFTTFIFFASSLIAQNNNCSCCSLEYRQFDYWLGDWDVLDTSGNLVGQNTIVSLQDNCVLQENWTSKNSTGTSYNYYNSKDSTWNQVWIDNSGNPLILKGAFQDGIMQMQSELLEGVKVPFYRNVITWSPNSDGTVTQKWDITNEKGEVLTTVFIGIYKRKSN